MSPRRVRPDPGSLVMPPGRLIPRTPPARPAGTAEPAPEAGPPPALSQELERAGAELSALAAVIRECPECGPLGSPRAFGSGYPRAPVFLLKARPSPEDLQAETAFAAEAERLERAFDRLGIGPAQVYGTVAWRADGGGERPCATHLLTEIEAVGPKVIVAFGPAAVDALRLLDGRCGITVPEELLVGEPVVLRPGLQAMATEPLPEGLTAPEAKRRLWSHLQALPGLIQTP